MAKSSTQFVCSECGWNGAKWFGRCPNCGEWGTIDEFHEARVTRGASKTSRSTPIVAASVGDLLRATTDESVKQSARVPTGFSEYDRVLGGGVVPGAVILMAGEPGIGKSTLLLETAGHIAAQQSAINPEAKVLYISGEESLAQIQMRASRIGAVHDALLMASTTDLDSVVSLISQEKPVLAVVDSAQTIHSQAVDGIPGGSTQVREVATALIDVAKANDIAVLLVGHVTKDGSIAGPRTLEHLVDAVCQFEGDTQTALRLLRSVKNRFGPTDEVGCCDMSGEGIEEV
ncbi:MAG: DNA repair protein RadA, partial [Alloscardovia omnicolens]|nr:DNA repair protein RadA [Alloscardovia omnicolens]